MIPVQQFPWLKWDDINAFGQGFNSAQDMYTKAVKNQYLQPTLEEQLSQAKSKSTIDAATARYADPMQQAKLAEAQMMAPYYGAQIDDVYQGRIPLQKAQAGLAGAQAGLARAETQNAINYPLKDELNGALSRYQVLAAQYGANSPQAQQAKGIVEVMSNKAQAMAAWYGANTQYKNLPTPVKNQMIAEGAPVGVTTTANKVDIFGNGNAVAPSEFIPYKDAQVSQQPQQISPYNTPGAGNVQPVQQQGYNSPGVKDVAESGAIHGTQTAAQQNQRMYAQSFDALAKQAAPLVESAARFSTLAGKAGMTIDKYASSLGISPENNADYQNYLKLTKQYVPAMANEFRRMLGGQATDKEQALMTQVTDPVGWDRNFDQSMALFNNMMAMANAQQGVLAQSPAQLQQTASKAGSSPSIQAGTQATQNQNIPANYVKMEHNGITYRVPPDKVEEMKKNGGKLLG